MYKFIVQVQKVFSTNMQRGEGGIEQWWRAERIFPTLGSPAAVSDDLKHKNEIYSYFVYF